MQFKDKPLAPNSLAAMKPKGKVDTGVDSLSIDTKAEKNLALSPDATVILLEDDVLSLHDSIKCKTVIQQASKSWLIAFLEGGGLHNLASQLVKLQGLSDKEPEELQIQYELLLGMKAAMNDQAGLDVMVDQPDLMASLALNIDSEEAAICSQTLELLAVLMVTGELGARAVLEALDFFKLVTRERVRFQSLVEALSSEATNYAFKRDIMLFLNTVINTASELEERLEIRADLIYSGMLRTVEKLKQTCFDELGTDAEGNKESAEELQELEVQLQVFETVLQRDGSECVTDLESTFQSGEVDLSDPEQIFQSLHASSVEHECFLPFLSTLQSLLAIPSFDAFGKLQWGIIDQILQNVVSGDVLTEDGGVQGGIITNAKAMLNWKQRVEDLSQQLEYMTVRCHDLEEVESTMKSELEDLRKKESIMLYMREKERRAAEVLSRQVRHLTEVRQADAELVAKAEQVLSSTPMLLSHYVTYGWDPGAPESGNSGGYTRRSSGSILGNTNYHRRLTRALSGAETSGAEERRSSLAGPVQVPVVREKGFRNLSVVNESTPPLSPVANCLPPPPPTGKPFFPRSPPRRPSLSKSAVDVANFEEFQSSIDTDAAGSKADVISNDNRTASNSTVHDTAKIALPIVNTRYDNDSSDEEQVNVSDNQSIELRYKKRIFELEVMLQEAEREKQREQDMFVEKEKDYKRKLSKYEASKSESKPNGETNDANEGGARASLIAMLNKKQQPSSPTKKQDEGSPAEARGNLMAMLAQRGPGGGALGRTSSSKNVASSSIAVLGIKPAVKSDKSPPLPPPLPLDAGKVLSSQPGGIPLAPPLPGTVEVVRAREAPAKPKKPVVEPRVAMRSLFWSKIPDRAISTTVWEQLSDSEVKLDIEALESMFCKAIAKPESDEKKDSSIPKSEKNKEVTLLDSKVQQNVGIALVKYRMPSHDIKTAIIRMDESKLDMEKLISLRALAPSTDDIATLKEYDGDVELLGRVEKFFMMIMNIPRYTQRLDCFIFKLKFKNLIHDSYHQYDTLGKALDQIQNSSSLRKLLEIVLAIGNYLNGGTARGGIYGFKLDGLLKLPTIKSVDNKLSLIHFVSMHCESTDAALLNVDQELSMVEDASRISLDQCRSEIISLRKNIVTVQEQIDTQISDKNKEPGDRFVEVLTPFKAEAWKELNKLEAEFNALCSRFCEVAELFGEEGKKVTAEEFLGLIRDFVQNFIKAHRENEKRRILNEKAEMKKNAEEKLKRSRENRRAAEDDANNLVDDLFGSLRVKKADEIVESLKGSGWGVGAGRRKKEKGPGGAPNRRHLPGGKSFRRGEEDTDVRVMLDRPSPRSHRNQLHVDTAIPSSVQRRSPPPITYEAILALASEINEDKNTSPPPSMKPTAPAHVPAATPKAKRSPSITDMGPRRDNKLEDANELAAFFNKKKKEVLDKQSKRKL